MIRKRKSLLDYALENIDAKIDALKAARAELVAQADFFKKARRRSRSDEPAEVIPPHVKTLRSGEAVR